MSPDAMLELILDALYYRRWDPDADCLQTNVAAQELEQQSSEVLPAIEQVLTEVVGPKLSESSDNPFIGLAKLLGAYLLLGARYDPARVVPFLRTVPTELKARAIANVPVFFRKTRVRPLAEEVNNLKPIPDEQLIAFVKESAQSDVHVLREAATRAMSFLAG